jgi:hypothetical protein
MDPRSLIRRPLVIWRLRYGDASPGDLQQELAHVQSDLKPDLERRHLAEALGENRILTACTKLPMRSASLARSSMTPSRNDVGQTQRRKPDVRSRIESLAMHVFLSLSGAVSLRA